MRPGRQEPSFPKISKEVRLVQPDALDELHKQIEETNTIIAEKLGYLRRVLSEQRELQARLGQDISRSPQLLRALDQVEGDALQLRLDLEFLEEQLVLLKKEWPAPGKLN